ncbi:VTT domain-containing protein [Maridesulfovibrio sp.]|uniref:TVP38/TMEM64 family protein n=1 Tax=Maridesulfovibrio sp. TaxID=2795000 RepID=UPI002A18AF6C|nr:VTT domain-containing protein [Maridesulfovibrio sp.]
MVNRSGHGHKIILHGLVLLAVVGGISYAAEHFGEGHLSAITAWIEKSGNFAPLVFMLINVVCMTLGLPQTIFTVVAGVLFGALKGTAMCLISMAGGASVSFVLGRYIFRGLILRKFGSDPNFRRIEMLSHHHPVKVLALSRLVPVVPYSIANYLLSVTRIRYIPYIIMSVVCLIPETVFLTAGGHILSAGVLKGSFNWKLLAALLVAGGMIVLLVRATRRSIEKD